MSVQAPDDSNLPPGDSSGVNAPPSSGGTSTSAPAAVSGGTGSTLGAQLAGVGTNRIALVCLTAGVPVQGPGRTVAPDEVVEITPIPTNVVNAFTAATPGDAKNGPNRDYWVPTAQPRVVQVARLNEIWMYTPNAGEGILITVRKK